VFWRRSTWTSSEAKHTTVFPRSPQKDHFLHGSQCCRFRCKHRWHIVEYREIYFASAHFETEFPQEMVKSLRQWDEFQRNTCRNRLRPSWSVVDCVTPLNYHADTFSIRREPQGVTNMSRPKVIPSSANISKPVRKIHLLLLFGCGLDLTTIYRIILRTWYI